MNIKTNDKRIFYYDFLRAFAIITIIACHVSGAYNFDYIFNQSPLPILYFNTISFFNHSSQIGISIFIMLSGALLINRDYSLKNFFKKRFSRVMLPFIFWTLLLIIVEMLVFNNYDPISFLNIFIADPKTHGHVFWFVWMIIAVYFLIFIFNRIISLFNSENQKHIIHLMTAVFVTYCIIVSLGLFNPSVNRLTYYSSFFGYAIFGYWFVNTDFVSCKLLKPFKITPSKIVILSCILSLALYLYLSTDICLTNSIQQNRFAGSSLFDVFTLTSVFFVFLFFRYLDDLNITVKIQNGLLGKLIYSLSLHSYGIYFSHYLFIIILSYFLFVPIGLYYRNPLKILPFLTIFYLIISWITVYILGKIPYIQIFSGKG